MIETQAIGEDEESRTINTVKSRATKTRSEVSENLSSSSSTVSGGSSSTGSNTAVDLERKVKMLKSELQQKKDEAEKLKQTLKMKEKTKLREKEEFLRKKINSYDALIGKIKTALDTEQEQLKIKTKEVRAWEGTCQ